MKTALAGLVAATMTLSGCFSISYDLSSLPEDSVQMTSSSTGNTGRHFVAHEKAYFVLSGLVPLGQPDVSGVVERESRGRRVQNLRIKSEQSFLDGLVSAGLGGLVGFVVGTVAASGNSSSATTSAASLVTAGLGLLIPQIRTITIEGDLVNERRQRPEKTPADDDH